MGQLDVSVAIGKRKLGLHPNSLDSFARFLLPTGIERIRGMALAEAQFGWLQCLPEQIDGVAINHFAGKKVDDQARQKSSEEPVHRGTPWNDAMLGPKSGVVSGSAQLIF
jgi:hypothetical protein